MLGHPFLTKSLFFGRLSATQITRKLEEQLATSEEKLADFRRIRKGMIERGVDPYRIAVLDLGIAQQREKVRWLKQMGAEVGRSGEKPRKAGSAA